MAKKLTHKTRALQMLEALGWTVADVEKQLRHSFTTVDLFGFADLLAVNGSSTLAVQVTSDNGGHVSDRLKKALAEPRLAKCLSSGWLVEVWGVRNKPTNDGSTVLARYLELSADGDRVVAYAGSNILTL